PISGYIVTGEREGLSVVTLRGKENDPILAHWQYGLGKAVAFTSDTSVKWATAWTNWSKYRAFWEQHIRWVMRPSGNADMRVVTEELGDKTKVIVEALDANGERLNFVRFTGRVAGPNNFSEPIELRQVGPGRYEGVFDSSASGAYLASLQYVLPGATKEGENGDQGKRGTVQAAVTRPYADEFRTLQDNAGLLKLVAERTGGRVIDPDPRKADLWSKQGLTMPVTLRPIWMLVGLIAIGMFLMDVAVRRVRLEPRVWMEMLRRGASKSVSQGSQKTGSLREARERAQQGFAGGSEGTPTVGARPKPTAEERKAAGVKFEVSEEQLKKAKRLESTAEIGEPGTPEKDKPTSSQPAPEQATNQEQGMSRLMKAKKRAQDKIDE
ncbi:MAG TPA: glutamine amidotransferase, partial [Polyangiaceae bacterium]|nr:glutamine amidotransferase [Polyangiaceae bacterium]